MPCFKHLLIIILSLNFTATSCQKKPCSYKGGEVDYLYEINCESDFDILQSTPLKNNFSNIKSVKVVYDIAKDIVYFTESKKYKYHFNFCSEYLSAYNDLGEFNNIEYGNSKQRKFAICNLNFYATSSIATIEFFPDDKIDDANVAKVFNKVKSATYFSNNLKVLINSWASEKWQTNKQLSFISVDSIYKGQVFQSMKQGEAFGYVRFVEKDEINNNRINEKDIIVLKSLPNNLPLCAATITTVFQTPLCHINILSQNRNTPNCMLKNAYQNINLLNLKDKLVHLQITDDTLIIKPATEQEANRYWNKINNKKAVSLSCNTDVKKLLPVQEINIKYINTVGGKAANMGELAQIRFNKNQRIPIPEKSFAIPFYFYKKHIADNKIDELINALLNDNKIINDKIKLESSLKEIREKIINSKIDDNLIALVVNEIGEYKNSNFRFRSSTNAEDIPGFNGAGLYDSKTGNVTNPKKPIEKAIKEVWASLWLLRAFEERCYFKIDQTNLAMGILVNKAFGTEEANGVAVTKNLYRDDYPAFTINVQLGEVSVVQPDDNIRAEQFLINFSSAISGDRDDLAVDYICHSSLNEKASLLSNKEVRELADYLMEIKKHYWTIYGIHRNVSFDNFAMDVEFKLDKGTRKIYIKQARVF